MILNSQDLASEMKKCCTGVSRPTCKSYDNPLPVPEMKFNFNIQNCQITIVNGKSSSHDSSDVAQTLSL